MAIEGGQSPTSVIPWKCDLGRNQRNQLSVLWNFSYPDHTHTLRLVSPWGRPEYTLHCPIQYTSRQHTPCPIGLPYSPGTSGGHPTAQRLPLQSPQHTQHTLASGRAYPWYPAYTVFKKSPRGHTDYKTTRLQILPANREHKAQRRQNTEKALDGKYREIAQRRQIREKA